MPFELKVPAVGESITEVQIGQWLKTKGEAVKRDEALVVIESDKATVEVPAPTAGVVATILKQKGETAKVGEVIGYIEEAALAAPAARTAAALPSVPAAHGGADGEAPVKEKTRVMPAAQRALAQHGLRADEVDATGPGGRLLKEDVLRKVEAKAPEHQVPATPSAPAAPVAPPVPAAPAAQGLERFGVDEEVVPMTPMRRRIAERLVEAQHSAALLTTFNEIDMGNVMALRKQYQESFVARYGVKLGFMSFFVKAAIDALKLIPQVNAEIRGTNIVYKNHYDIGMAIGGGKGLVVPIIRNAEAMSFAEIEKTITDYGGRAKDNKITLDELKGGTFTITNGGVYGSLLSTPIVNPPQSAILGLHAIQDRPVARDGQVVIRPMMYVALTYDHRIIDGREAVTFLKRLKEVMEEPSRMLLEV